MLDGQGSPFPVRHFRGERASHAAPPSCFDLFNSDRSEASAESSPNPNPAACSNAPSCGRSDVDFPCSLDASDSSIGELVELRLGTSAACHCFPASRAKADAAQARDAIGAAVAEDVAGPVLSLWIDSGSTDLGSPTVHIEQSETGASSISGGEVDETGTVFSIFSDKSLEISRSAQTEERCIQTASGSEICADLLQTSYRDHFAEERSVGTVGEVESNSGAFNLNECQHIETSKVSVMSFEALNSVSDDQSDKKHDSESGCFSHLFMKDCDDASSQSVCTEEIIGKQCASGFSATRSVNSEIAFLTGHKRARISGDVIALGGSGIQNVERSNESQNDNSTQQQQPYLPGLDNETALKCFSFVPISALGQLAALGRQYRELVKSRLIFKLRRLYGMVEHLVFIYTSAGVWTAYDANRNLWRTLPMANVDQSFNLQDRESLSAGTHVLWLGKEAFDFVYYRYDLVADIWERGPSMVNPRCLFASASCGEYAYVAGGFGPANDVGALNLLNSAEKYNSVTAEWELLPPMHTPRHKCSGFFMDGKFYVIGGRDINHQPVMSGEEFNPLTGMWREIPNMYFVPVVNRRDMFEPSPPLVAVVNNHLYAVENTTNILKMYNKGNNTWSNLGFLPVQADLHNGWGVAFKALGNRLFLMGDSEGIITAYSWQPGANPTEPYWTLLCRRERGAGSFLYNCAVMTC